MTISVDTGVGEGTPPSASSAPVLAVCSACGNSSVGPVCTPCNQRLTCERVGTTIGALVIDEQIGHLR